MVYPNPGFRGLVFNSDIAHSSLSGRGRFQCFILLVLHSMGDYWHNLLCLQIETPQSCERQSIRQRRLIGIRRLSSQRNLSTERHGQCYRSCIDCFANTYCGVVQFTQYLNVSTILSRIGSFWLQKPTLTANPIDRQYPSSSG